MAHSNLFTLAAMSGVVKAINYYIARGDDINATDSNGQTPLFHAASKGHMDACIVLLEAGAIADILDSQTQTVADIARRAKHYELADFLDVVIKHSSHPQVNRNSNSSNSSSNKIGTKSSLNQANLINIKKDNIHNELINKSDQIAEKKKVEFISSEEKDANADERRSRLKLLIILGMERGYLTYAEINDHLPDDVQNSEHVDDIIGMINDMGIQVYEEAPDPNLLLLLEDSSHDVDEGIFKDKKNRKNSRIAEKKNATNNSIERNKNVDTLNFSFFESMASLVKERGYITYSEINDHLPSKIHNNRVQDIARELNEKGIQVFKEAPDMGYVNQNFNITSFLHSEGVYELDALINEYLLETDFDV
jgi:hypothetical protein